MNIYMYNVCTCTCTEKNIVCSQLYQKHPFALFLRGYSQQLQVYQHLCASMLSEINTALKCLGEIAKRHSFVTNKTGALHMACEKLIQDQV